LGDAEVAAARAAMGWADAPFEIPQDVYAGWHAAADRGRAVREAWTGRLAKSPKAGAFKAAHAAPDAKALDAAITAYKAKLSADKPKVATRKSSEMALEVINETLPNTVGGSADLTGSNNTRSSKMATVAPGSFTGNYIHYGICEHGMAAAMNGIALHGGLKPYGGTFLAFADYCRPAMRLSALMGVPVVYVMTHDSIGLGEDCPTHQPVETIASLRAMPNILVFRPCDAVETAEAWQIAMTEAAIPSVLALSRQNLPTVRTEHSDTNKTAKGAYVLRGDGDRDVTLIATGSEIEIALAAADKLAEGGIRAAVVSAPCFELFAKQSAADRAAVLGKAPRIGIEAAIRQGSDLFLRPEDGFVGMTGFGASAPAPELYRHFGITAEAVADLARSLI
jgi:transketolase